jgi:ribonuclease HII
LKKICNRFRYIIGVDEAGRGPIAGPVSAAALVCMPSHVNLIAAADSKVLSEKKREEIYGIIKEDPTISFAFSFVSHSGQFVEICE